MHEVYDVTDLPQVKEAVDLHLVNKAVDLHGVETAADLFKRKSWRRQSSNNSDVP
jgi:hypothetical protein